MTTAHAAHLEGVARRVAAPFVELGAVAALVAGSVAEGLSDEWSDIDLILFYDSLPAAAQLAEARDGLGGINPVPLGGSVDAGAYLEQFWLDGVACQLVHQTQAAWQAQAATVTEALDVDTPVQKAFIGLHEGIVLHGHDVVADLRSAAVYPDALAVAMVERHQGVFPLWRVSGSIAARDCALWVHAEAVTGVQHLLAILAGVNRVWFSSFQLKRVHRLETMFEHSPDRLADRIDELLVMAPTDMAAALRQLVVEVVDIVERVMPAADSSRLRGTLGPPVAPWALPA